MIWPVVLSALTEKEDLNSEVTCPPVCVSCGYASKSMFRVHSMQKRCPDLPKLPMHLRHIMVAQFCWSHLKIF